MRIGDTLVINVDKTMPNFFKDYTCDQTFPTNEIFDYENWHIYSKYMTMVRPDENVDLVGNKKCFMMNQKFQLVVLATYKTDEDIKRLY